MKYQSEIMMDLLTLCPVGMDVQEGDAGACISQRTMSTASPQQPIFCSEEPRPCPGRMVACREGLTKGHCLQEPSQKTLLPTNFIRIGSQGKSSQVSEFWTWKRKLLTLFHDCFKKYIPVQCSKKISNKTILCSFNEYTFTFQVKWNIGRRVGWERFCN